MEERRQYKRLYATKHANGYDFALEVDGSTYQASLVNISRGGAMVRLGQDYGYSLYGKYGSISDDYYGQPYLKGTPYTVAWQQDRVMGIRFAEPLGVDETYLKGYYASGA